jgi:hypothetical protein
LPQHDIFKQKEVRVGFIMTNETTQRDRSFIHVGYGMRNKPYSSRDIVEIEASLTFSIKKRTGSYIATCPELHLKDQGESPREAFNNLVDMILALISDAIGSDELEDVLKGYGFVQRKSGNRQEFSLKREGEELPLSFKATAEPGRRIRAARLAWVG